MIAGSAKLPLAGAPPTNIPAIRKVPLLKGFPASANGAVQAPEYPPQASHLRLASKSTRR